jgi:lysophospholipid acyltransferase (LPLAT)-like uncharacterized protein
MLTPPTARSIFLPKTKQSTFRHFFDNSRVHFRFFSYFLQYLFLHNTSTNNKNKNKIKQKILIFWHDEIFLACITKKTKTQKNATILIYFCSIVEKKMAKSDR